MIYEDLVNGFMQRTMDIVENYSGEYEVTLWVNCLLGLVVLPRERLVKKIPETPIDELEKEWGIKLHIEKCSCKGLRQLVERMRHSIAHFDIEPGSEAGGEITHLTFKRQQRVRPDVDFDVKVSVEDSKKLVKRLAKVISAASQDKGARDEAKAAP